MTYVPPPMTPTENWLWALAEARDVTDAKRARALARLAMGAWRQFIEGRSSRPTAGRKA